MNNGREALSCYVTLFEVPSETDTPGVVWMAVASSNARGDAGAPGRLPQCRARGPSEGGAVHAALTGLVAELRPQERKS